MQTAHYTNVKPIPRHLNKSCLGRNSAFCHLPVSLQALLLPARVRPHVCERLDHTLSLFALAPCDMQQSYRLIWSTQKQLSVNHMMALCLQYCIVWCVSFDISAERFGEEFPQPAGILTPDRPSHSLDTILATIFRLPSFISGSVNIFRDSPNNVALL